MNTVIKISRRLLAAADKNLHGSIGPAAIKSQYTVVRMPSDPLLLFSYPSFHVFTVLDFSNHKNKNKVFLAGNKTCDKLNKMSTFVYVI